MAASPQGRDHSYQAFSASGPLSDNMNLSTSSLTQRIGMIGGEVYCYILTSVKYFDSRFVQTGSGPNFQGGLLTLCTCKGLMRTGRDLDAWEGIWIAGVTGAATGPRGRGNLFYLMRVKQTFESHRDLWMWLSEYAPEAAEAKAADKHRVGDVYHPRHPGGNPFDPNAYIPPRAHHVHSGELWRTDINYVGYGHRRPALLVGDPQYSFLWSDPCVPVPFHIGRGYMKVNLGELLPSSVKARAR